MSVDHRAGMDGALKTSFERFVDRSAGPDRCWLWTASLDGARYGQLVYKSVHYKAHRLAFEIYREPIIGGLFVLHSCDCRACVNPAHLWLGTHADNMADMVAKGRAPWMRGARDGEKNPNAKISNREASEIRAAYVPGIVSQRVLAARYGVSSTTIRGILTGERYRERREVDCGP